MPFSSSNLQELFIKICKEEPEFPETVHPLAISLMKRMLTKEPEQRATIKEIKEDPWVTNFGSDPMPVLFQEKIKVTDKDLKSVFTKVRLIARFKLNFQRLKKSAIGRKGSAQTPTLV